MKINGDGPQKPTAKDFDPTAVQRAVLKDTAQHLSSLSGLAAAILAGVATGVGLVSPVGWLVTAGAGAFWVGSWTWNFCFRNKTFSERHVKKLLAQRREYDQRLIEALEQEFRAKEFTRGLKEADDLWTCYESLVRLMDDQAGFDDPEATQYRNLADTLYEAGCFNLRKACELWRTLQSIDIPQLERERTHYDGQRRRMRNGTVAEELERQVRVVAQRITDAEEFQAKFMKRLTDADEIEGTLTRAAGKLSDLGVGSSHQSIDWGSAAKDLESAVKNAIESDEELKKLVEKNF